MRLKKIWIDGFKNLNNFEIDFENNNGKTVLIGNNGSGKSNVLEAISAIFIGLYKLNTPQRKPNFEYEIEYEIDDVNYKLELKRNNNTLKYRFTKNDENIQVSQIKAQPSNYLPNLIMIYSGEEIRLWDKYYNYSYSDFMKLIRSEIQTLPAPNLFYINRFYWNISLLTLLYSSLQNNIDFCKRILKFDNLDDIKIKVKFNQTNMENFAQNAVTSFINTLSQDNDEQEYTLVNFKSSANVGSERELYLKLMASVMNKESKYKLIESIQINFGDLTTEDLSEGEKKQILLRIALEVLANEKTLVLFDEPDANIHVANKVQIKEMLEEYENRETILTTHSPTLTHAFNEKHIYMLKDGNVEDKNKQEIFAEISNGIWNYQEQNIFLSSTKEIILLVEGKHDKAHILEAFKRLKNDYSELDFDIFYADGANNLKQLVLGFSTTDFDLENKKIIAIFDDDDDGRKGRSQQNFKKVENSDEIYYLKSNENFYGILLPEKDGFSGEFTIENMYPSLKFKDAMKDAFDRRNNDDNFYNTGINDISKKIKEDAKNILVETCKSFIDEDFEHFRKLFDLILEIKRLDNGNT
jgi:ABC-type cobalamin/Fe3+-siderophores transport system ATPase subunit